MVSKRSFFKLHANCIPVKGAKRSIICDLQDSRYIFIPNLLFEILCLENYSLDQINKKYDNELKKGIDVYLNFLSDKDWGFFTNIPLNFPKLNLEWDFPAKITNAIIDHNKKSDFSFRKIFFELEELSCEAVQIRFFNQITLDYLKNIGVLFAQYSFKYLEIMLPFDPKLESLSYKILFECIPSLRCLTLYNSDINETIDVQEDEGMSQIIKTTNNIESCSQCGITNKEHFIINIQHFSEAQKYNTCLNRKISIDVNGNIKNCPSMACSFGNIKTGKLKDSIIQNDFKKLWNINKDQILVCKDCEFRYICVDCRAYLKDQEDDHSKPIKCNYNPYVAKWHENK